MWNFVYHAVFIIDKNLSPHWLNAVQSFWLGGLGFSCSIVWYPFIKRSLMQVGSDIIGRLSQRRRQVQIVRRIDQPQLNYLLQSSSSGTHNIDSSLQQPSLPIYRIPARWQQETLNPCSEDDTI